MSARAASPRLVHLMTQRDQPYGSMRQCCERCGLMCGYGVSPIWTDDEAAYDRPPPGYVRCANATPQQVEGDALIRAWLCFAFAVAEVARVVVDVNAPWPAAEDIWEHGGAWHVVLGTYEDEHGRVCVAFTDHTTALAGRMLCDRSWTRVHPVTDADAA